MQKVSTHWGVGLIVPDVHERIEKLQSIVDKYAAVDWILFLGDWFDTLGPDKTLETATWVADNAANPKYTFLYGNHDIHYAWPIESLISSGYELDKQVAIDRLIKRNVWNNFRLMAWVGSGDNEWLCTHAGLHPHLCHPVHGFGKHYLSNAEERALMRLQMSDVDQFVAIGKSRNGRATVGGVDWLDWETEFEPIPGLNQIVGHSENDLVRFKTIPTSKNVCIDTHLKHVIIIDTDSIEIIDEP